MFYHITNTAFLKSDRLSLTSHPLFRTWHHFMYDIKSTVSDLTSTISVSSHPSYWWHPATIWVVSHTGYLWHHIPYIYDIISTKYDIRTLCVVEPTVGICVTSFSLQMTSHPFYHTKPQYLWCHIHFRHDIMLLVSDIAPTLSLSSQPLRWYHTQVWMTSHPPSVWHHMHYI